jgi:Ca-activated chloride channel homolog
LRQNNFVRTALLAIVVCVLCADAWMNAQSTVTVFVTVTDAQGRYVTDLQKDDFEVLGDGEPQSAMSVDRDARPLKVIVMLDRRASMNGAYPRLYEGVMTFLTRLQPGDQLRVGGFSGKVEFSSRFTATPLELLADLSALDYGNGTKLYDAVMAGCNLLNGVDGRPVLVMATDGDDTDSRGRRDAVVNRLRTSTIETYAVGVTTKYFNGLNTVQVSPGRDFKMLPEDTGGAFFEVKNLRDTASVFSKLAEELHSQYVLAFSPSQRDGRVHKLAVRINRPSLTARANASYVAMKSE